MTKSREFVLDTDWVTALVVAAGLLFVFLIVASDIWRLFHGIWSVPEPDSNLFWRIWHSAFTAFAIYICFTLSSKSTERILKFAFGMLLVGAALYVARLWTPSMSALQQPLCIAQVLIEVPALVMLAIYGVKWFRNKVVHV